AHSHMDRRDFVLLIRGSLRNRYAEVLLRSNFVRAPPRGNIICRYTFMYEKYIAWQRPTLARGSPLLPSALRSLTSVFGMGTGVTFSPSSPDKVFIFRRNVHSLKTR